MQNTSSDRRILVTGVTGQVGHELMRSLQGLGEVIGVDRSVLDLTNEQEIRRVVRQIKPTLIVNPAAYTAVDKAETEQSLAQSINEHAPRILAEEAGRLNAPLIHYSTDYVFDGDKSGSYVEDDLPNPQNAYGRSKLAGENAIRSSGCSHVILRTSWVYGSFGANFVKTMLRLGQERDILRVVGDQFGAPTCARTLADMTAHIVAQGFNVNGALSGTFHGISADEKDWWQTRTGVYHLTAAGEASWADFAKAIFEMRGYNCYVESIPSCDYPTPATRPKNSRLSLDKFAATFGLVPPAWKSALAMCLEEI